MTQRRKCVRRSESEIAEILREYDRSGLTQHEFAREQGVALSSLTYWLRRARQDGRGRGGSSRSRALVPVRVRPGSAVQLGYRDDFVEIILRNGRLLRVPTDIDTGTLAALLPVLEETC